MDRHDPGFAALDTQTDGPGWPVLRNGAVHPELFSGVEARRILSVLGYEISHGLRQHPAARARTASDPRDEMLPALVGGRDKSPLVDVQAHTNKRVVVAGFVHRRSDHEPQSDVSPAYRQVGIHGCGLNPH